MTFRSYAQNFEDVILWRALKEVSDGFYVDIGAWDPVVDSVSMAFYEQGWRGVHVEPVPSFAGKLRAARPDEVVIEAAVSSTAGEIALFAIEGSGLSTGIKKNAQHHENAGHHSDKIMVCSRTLASIFDEIGDRQIHWMKVDVEGMEKAVLSGWGTAMARPWVIVIESTLPNSPIEDFKKWEPLVLERGYEFVYFDGLNRYYVHEDHAELRASFGPGPNVFDSFVLMGSPFLHLANDRISVAEEGLRNLGSELEEKNRALEDVGSRLSSAIEVHVRLEGMLKERQSTLEDMNLRLSAAADASARLASVVEDKTGALADLERRLSQALESKERDLENVERRRSEAVEARARLEGALEEKSRSLADKDMRLSQSIEAQGRLAGALEAKNLALADIERRLAAATEACSRLEQMLDEKGRALMDRDFSLAALGEEKLLLEVRIAYLEQARLKAEAPAPAAPPPVDHARAELERHVRALEEQFKDITTSTSWRVTAPLRVVGGAARWLKHELGAWFGRNSDAGVEPDPSLALESEPAEAMSGPELPVDLAAEPVHVRALYHRLIHARDTAPLPAQMVHRLRPRLAYLSPLPPEQTGIADYSAELLPELGRHYAIDVVVSQSHVRDDWIEANCNIRSIEWFEKNAYVFDRIVYHLGNSPFHHHMFPLLETFPGVVVLHDFFLGNLLAFLELHGGWHGHWTRALLESHGYGAMEDRFKSSDLSEVTFKYPANLVFLQQAQGVIVHSDYARQLASEHYGNEIGSDWIVIPHPRHLPGKHDRVAARRELGIADNEFLVCSFGSIGETKLNDRLVSAWAQSELARDENSRLVLVGEVTPNEFSSNLRRLSEGAAAKDRVRICGFVEPETYRLYLQAADLAVQLRTHSRGETSGAILDCMAHAIPTIVNANGSAAEIPRSCVLMLADEFSDDELAHAMNDLWVAPSRRDELGQKAAAYVRDRCAPEVIGGRYKDAIETIASRQDFQLSTSAFAAHVGAVKSAMRSDADWLRHARRIAQGAHRKRKKKFFIDVSAIACEDLKTGIQRVVKSQVIELLANPPEHFQVEPILAVKNQWRWDYYYARRFVAGLLSLPEVHLEESPIEVGEGDIFFGADLHTHSVISLAKEGLYDTWRQRGVSINFLVHDLLPITLTQHFPKGSDREFREWVAVVTEKADGVICTTQAIAEEMKAWIDAHGTMAAKRVKILSCPPGADFKSSIVSRGLPDDAGKILHAIASVDSFLMVGTVEPRKGYDQTLRAFERLWSEGESANLVIVGKKGWMVDDLTARLRDHPQRGKQLFWLEAISDEYLEKVYAACTCLIAASEGEGFGLPLIEAARHRLPIVARGIPVFREVAGECAFYFAGKKPDDLVRAIRQWRELYAGDRHPKTDGMRWLTWEQSIERLKAMLLRNVRPATYMQASTPHARHASRARLADDHGAVEGE